MANYTSVTASNICDAAGNKLASGTVSFVATDAANQPLNFQVGGGGQVVTTPATAVITAGAIAGGFQVADSANTSPAGILYRITITDTTLNRVVVTYSLVTVTGTAFNLDNFSQTGAAVLPPVGGSVNGPLVVNGNLSVTGSYGTISASAIEGVRFADQFVSIQAAVNDAAAANPNGWVVQLAVGTSVVSGLVLPSNGTLQGYGQGKSVLQMPASSAAGAFVIGNNTMSGLGNSNIILRDFTIDGNKTNQTNTGQMGVKFDRVSKSIITHVEIKNTTGLAASAIQWLDHAQLDNTTNTDNEVSFCYLHDNGTTPTNNADGLAIGGVRLRIVGNSMVQNADSGIGLQGAGTDSVVIADNFVKDNLGAAGIAAGPNPGTAFTPSAANTNLSITGNVVSGANSYGIYLHSTTGFSIAGGSVAMAPGATAADSIHIENCFDGIISTKVNQASGNGIYVTSTNNSTTSGIQIFGEYRNSNLNGIKVDSFSAGCTTQDITICAIAKNNSQSPTNTSSGLQVLAGGTIRRINICGGIYSDDQGSPTQKYGIDFGGSTVTLSSIGGAVVCAGNATGAFNGLSGDTRLSPAQTGASASATSTGDAVQVGDNVNMPNSSTRNMSVWGRDPSGNFRRGLIQNTTGTDFWVGFGDALGGLHVDINAGKVELIAEGSNQPVNLTPTGSGKVVIGGGGATIGGGSALARYARYSLTLSPVAVAANTTAEQSFATSVTSGDVIIGVSKPTTQAGLGIVGHRASGTTLFITFSNNTASPITPTASEVYQVIAVQ